MDPNPSSALSILAFALMQNGRAAKAVILLEALDQLEPGQVATLQALAAAQVRSGKPEQALDTLDRLAMAGGAGPLFLLLRAQALAALDRAAEATTAMQSFLQSRESLLRGP